MDPRRVEEDKQFREWMDRKFTYSAVRRRFEPSRHVENGGADGIEHLRVRLE